MAPILNGRVLFNSIPDPETYPIPGKTVVYDDSQTIDLENVTLNGGFLVTLSIDPYMRSRMCESHIKSYAPPFPLCETINNLGVGVVLRPGHTAVKKGDHVYGYLPFQEYVVIADPAHMEPVCFPWRTRKVSHGAYTSGSVACQAPVESASVLCAVSCSVLLVLTKLSSILENYLGTTAHHAWKEYSRAKAGETAFVTVAAGAVSATVVQLAKADGLKVIASAGSDEKVAFVKSLGADVVFNYKKEDTKAVLEREGGSDMQADRMYVPRYVMLRAMIRSYWDNVGGQVLEAALDAAHRYARFIECGSISSYNSEPYGVKNTSLFFEKELSVNGFIVGSLYPKYIDSFYQEIPLMVASGQIKYTEDRSTGLQSVGEAILLVQKGTNTGKKVIIVAGDA
ncbi:NAD-P-binding protein [Fomitopsis betulina]|nr:NAD-P-binding protein [Fomitopsis betulina]